MSVAATVAYNHGFLGDTMPAKHAGSNGSRPQTLASHGATAQRTTVLPKVTVRDGTPTLLAEEAERYEELAPLGQGGMGEVVKVTDNDIQRTVAIKRLLPGLEDPAVLSRFVEEIRIVGQLEHPNIVPVHDVGVDAEGQYYFVMKYVEGETLESIIAKLAEGNAVYHRRYPIERRVEIFLDVLEAIQYAHERGIIHRDIKPANVMVGPHGEVMVMDWGVAKRIKGDPGPDLPKLPLPPEALGKKRFHETMVGALIGTPAYMSPEQAGGYPLDERSDIYSLTVLLHELLGLRHYLESKESLEEVVRGVLLETPSPVSLSHSPHQPAPPLDLTHFVRKGVKKVPDERYQSVAEMISILRARREGNILIQCPVTFTKRAIHGLLHLMDRHPIVTMATLAMTILGSASGMGYGVAHLFGAL